MAFIKERALLLDVLSALSELVWDFILKLHREILCSEQSATVMQDFNLNKCMYQSTLFLILRMGATVFVQPLDLVKNRMQLSGQGSKAREYKTSLHAVASILRNEGVGGIYTG